MTIYSKADELHRLVKRAMDSGAAKTTEEAESTLKSYRIDIEYRPADPDDPHSQAALLTLCALARRVFLGGAFVSGDLDVQTTAPLSAGGSLRQAIRSLGARPEPAPAGAPKIFIGGQPAQRQNGFAVRAVFGGWSGGIIPAHEPEPCELPPSTMHLAPMLAAALAVNEAFLHCSGEMPSAGRRTTGLSLWDPAADWLEDAQNGPSLEYLPSSLWLIGLGHLGQAYLWGLGLLPYPQCSSLQLVLQDDDFITPSTESTSMLSSGGMIGQRKTRAMAGWAEARGFKTILTERLFDERTARRFDEPAVALCGVDNAAARRALDGAGFDLVVEAGLGRGHADFRSLLVHTLPGAASAAEIWKDIPHVAREAAQPPAYERLLADKLLDQCGVTLLAGKAVGAPFVGCVAATLVLSEVLRLLHGATLSRLIDLSLVNLDHRRVVKQTRDFSRINPGFILVSK